MSKRITLTDTEIKYINQLIEDYMEEEGDITAFTEEGVKALREKLIVPEENKDGLLRIHHELV